MVDFLLVLPWIVLALTVVRALERRPRLRDYGGPEPDEAPSVSIIVPARNEAHNIGRCVRTLLSAAYPDVEIVVVDDRSDDGTGQILEALAERGTERVRVVSGQPLPEGWFGKPWACWQGYRVARGELLLFTDADTYHDPLLLAHAVGALLDEDAALVTVVPRQLMKSFWERVVMPQFLTLISLRYRRLARINRARDPKDAIANGQFILIDRAAYEAIGGHEAVRGEVTEDQALAQRTVASGRRVFIAHAEELMATRMYRSLPEIVEGWTKNVATGARHAVAPWLRPAVPWLIAAFLIVAWIVPPAVVVADVVGGANVRPTGWPALATLLSLATWLLVYVRMRVPRGHALLYPVGAAVAAFVFALSAVRGGRVRWKGREYDASGPDSSPERVSVF